MAILTPKTYKALVILYTAITFGVYVLNIVQVSGPDGTFFTSTFQDRQNGHASPMLCADFTFSVAWVLIYLFDVGWISYVLHASFFREKYKNSTLLYYVPVTYWIIVMSVGLAILNIIWLVMYDRDRFNLSFATLIVYTGLTITTLIVGVRDFHKHCIDLSKKDFIIISVFVHNGVGIKFAWLLYQTGLNFATVLYNIVIPGSPVNNLLDTIDVFDIGLSDAVSMPDIHLVSFTNAGYGAFGLIVSTIVVYGVIDLIFFSNNFRYVISPYLMWSFGFLGTYVHLDEINDYETIKGLVTGGIVIMLIVTGVKCILMKFLKYKKPGSDADKVISQIETKLGLAEDNNKKRQSFIKNYGHLFKKYRNM